MHFKRALRYLILAVCYAAMVHVAYLGSLLLRFEAGVPSRYWHGYLLIAPVFTALSLVGFGLAGLFQGLWRYASTVTLFQVIKGATLSAFSLVLIMVFVPEVLFPRSLVVMVWAAELLVIGGVRFAWRLSRERVLGPSPRRAVRTLVVGAGSAGVHLIQEMRRGPSGHEPLTPIGFIDEDPGLAGQRIEGVRVQGSIADLPRILSDQKVEMVVVSNPELPAKVVREIARFCAEGNVRVKTLPGLSDLHSGRSSLAQMRDVRIEDLLGREPVHLDLDEVAEFVRGERVLVTGAGGSIGSELARQAALFGPAELVLLDHAENGLYFVHHELAAHHLGLPLHPVVADIRDPEGVEAVMRRFRPTLVLHAAAHKHVPLLELNPREAILNNVVGTRNLMLAADRHGVHKFVLISTDKAVNPSSVMGATKRVCEMMLQSRSQHSETRFLAVRFGNVLGSEGSVIPLFRRQLERGGPLTVTHPDARRYFMTIPEAVRLVLQAAAMGKGGEVFLLEMGEQVRILDLARQLIRLAGLREGEDIDIVFTGLRPGEKLYEELLSDSERTRITRHERILVWDLEAREEAGLLAEVAELERLATTGDAAAIRSGLRRLVPEYIETRAAPYEPPPMTPVVELPASAPAPAPSPQRVEWQDLLRRAVDVTAAGAGLMLSLPVWVLLRAEAHRHGEQRILNREVRIGRTRRRSERRGEAARAAIDRRYGMRRVRDLPGQPFECLRFRSDLGPLSRWLARRGLDAIPCLLNVLGGEMTLVGPHPEREDMVLRWQALVPDYGRRFTVLPGATGLAQVSECSEADADGVVRRVHYDLFYMDNRSVLLDVRTLGRTLGVMLRRSDGRADAARSAVTRSAPSDRERHPPGTGPTVKGVTR